MVSDISPWLRFCMAALTGLISGFGIGGGTILVILLTLVFGVEQRMAQGINLLYFIPTAGASFFFHVKRGRIVWGVWLPAALAGVAAALLAAFLTQGMDVTLLRRFFGVLLAVTGAREVFSKNNPTVSK